MIDMSELIQTQNIEQLKQEMGPLKASQILRTTKYKQQPVGLCNPQDPGQVCAVGVIVRHFGWNGDINSKTLRAASDKTEKFLGNDIWDKIVLMNNNEHLTFSQIADRLDYMGL